MNLFRNKNRELLTRILSKLEGLERAVAVLDRRTASMATNISALQSKLDEAIAKATANTDTLGSISELCTGLKGSVTTLQEQVTALQEQIANDVDVDPADLQALQDGLGVLSAKLDEQATAQAVILNTPADPNA